MKRRIFTPSTILMRGASTRTQGGFFCFPFEGEFTPTIRRPASTKRLRSALPAQVELLTVVFGGPLSCFPPVTSTGFIMEIKMSDGNVAIIDDQDYDKVNGFVWMAKSEGKRMYAITLAGSIRMHRLIMRAKKGQIIDHINGNGLDNRRSNLRFCTDSQNQCNRGSTRGSAVPFKGVTWNKHVKKFQAQIQFHRKQKSLGYFDCPFKAARAYDAAAKELHGEFARLNFPEK